MVLMGILFLSGNVQAPVCLSIQINHKNKSNFYNCLITGLLFIRSSRQWQPFSIWLVDVCVPLGDLWSNLIKMTQITSRDLSLQAKHG